MESFIVKLSETDSSFDSSSYHSAKDMQNGRRAIEPFSGAIKMKKHQLKFEADDQEISEASQALGSSGLDGAHNNKRTVFVSKKIKQAEIDEYGYYQKEKQVVDSKNSDRTSKVSRSSM